MNKLYYVVVFLLLGNYLTAQETCEDAQILMEDLNSINKCFINHPIKEEKTQTKKTNRAIKPENSSNKRFLTVRKKTNAASLVKSLHSKGIQNTENKNFSELVSLIALKKEYNNTVYNFKNVDNIPVFSTCRNAKTTQSQHLCFNNEMMKFLNNEIENNDELEDEDFIGKITIEFIIDSNGKTNNIKASGHKGARFLKETIIDLVSKLPVFIPAKKANEYVPVKYQFSLNFSE